MQGWPCPWDFKTKSAHTTISPDASGPLNPNISYWGWSPPGEKDSLDLGAADCVRGLAISDFVRDLMASRGARGCTTPDVCGWTGEDLVPRRPVPGFDPVTCCGILSRPRKIENGNGGVRIALLTCTHSVGVMSPSLLRPTNSRHLFTTSPIVGRSLGLCCQQLSRSFHISCVSPTA